MRIELVVTNPPGEAEEVPDICPGDTINFCEIEESEGNYAEVCLCYDVLPECEEDLLMTCLTDDNDQKTCRCKSTVEFCPPEEKLVCSIEFN